MIAAWTMTALEDTHVIVHSPRWLHPTDKQAFVVDDLLTPAECEHLASLALYMEPSFVGWVQTPRRSGAIRGYATLRMARSSMGGSRTPCIEA